MTDDRQTLLGVIGYILFAVVVYMATSLLLFDATPSGEWAVERILAGSWFAITMVATRYHRLPLERRLPPAHAIGLGGVQLAVMGWLAVTALSRATLGWIMMIGFAGLAIPGGYLLVMGLRAVRAAGSTPRG